MSLYRYTFLGQDGTTRDLGSSKQKDFTELRELLGCSLIEVVHSDYYPADFTEDCTVYGDEEGRYLETNHINPHMKNLGGGWNCVGDLIREEPIK